MTPGSYRGYKPESGGFLERNPRLIDNYLAACRVLGVQPGEAPESLGVVSQEAPSEEVVRYFQRLHRLPEVGYIDRESGKPVAINPDTGKWETVG